MVESGRKHGPFDFRYPAAQKSATSVWGGPRHGDAGDVLGWYVFSDRFVPNPQRHDFEALGRYEAYRNATAQDPGRSAGASSAPRSPFSRRRGARRSTPPPTTR